MILDKIVYSNNNNNNSTTFDRVISMCVCVKVKLFFFSGQFHNQVGCCLNHHYQYQHLFRNWFNNILNICFSIIRCAGFWRALFFWFWILFSAYVCVVSFDLAVAVVASLIYNCIWLVRLFFLLFFGFYNMK